MRKISVLLMIAAAASSLLIASPANATLMMKLQTSDASLIITDNMAGDSEPLSGAITHAGTLGMGWNLTVSTAVGSQYFSVEQLDLNSIVGSAQGSTINIYVSETNLSTPLDRWTLGVGGVLANGASALFEAYFDMNNQPFEGTKLGDLSFSGTVYPQYFSGYDIGYVTPDSLYSLTIKAQITHFRSNVTSSFNAQLSPPPVPVPPSVLLLGTGLLGLVLFSRKRPQH